jgi:hypothetical protein
MAGRIGLMNNKGFIKVEGARLSTFISTGLREHTLNG